jgi:hypothetical protein
MPKINTGSTIWVILTRFHISLQTLPIILEVKILNVFLQIYSEHSTTKMANSSSHSLTAIFYQKLLLW